MDETVPQHPRDNEGGNEGDDEVVGTPIPDPEEETGTAEDDPGAD
jgi:hypothetical protein